MKALCRIRKEPAYRREAFEKGLQRVGFTLVDKATPTGPHDWLVIWNRKKGADEQEADLWEQRGGTVVVTENGYLAKTDKTHYAISVHGHNGSGWFPVGEEDRFSKLGFEIKPWRTNDSEVIVRAQRGIGSTLMASPPGWAEKTAKHLHTLTSMPVRVVYHPGDKDKARHDAAAIKNATALVTWSSAVGIRALVEGIPVFYAAPYWICSDAANQLKYYPLVVRDDPLRAAALHRMSWGQWHFDEIATGEPFKRIIEHRS